MLTRFGATQLLAGFIGIVPAGVTWELGLCAVIPTPDTALGDLEEPTIGVNGYARAVVTRNAAGFPGGVTSLFVQPQVRTRDVLFAPDAGTEFDVGTNRVFLYQSAPVGAQGLMLIGPPVSAEPVRLAASQPENERTFSLIILGF